MKLNVLHILEGIKNSVFVKEEVENIAQERKKICDVCPNNSSNRDKAGFDPNKFFSLFRPDAHCTACACNLHAKVRSLHTDCPLGKWSAVASKEEAAKIAAVTDAQEF